LVSLFSLDFAPIFAEVLELDDIEVRRNDAAFLDALGARTIPDPTTAGDYCRRFDGVDIWRLMRIINDVRVDVWRRQPADFRETARIDVDGSVVATTAECKEGMDRSYTGVWGYHPLLVTLANTREPLFIINRSGNRPSHEGAPAVLNRAIELCWRAGFQDILLRGDTDFTMTTHLDEWNDDAVRFVFGYDANPTFVNRAGNLGDQEYAELVRRADRLFVKHPRAKPPRVKEERDRPRAEVLQPATGLRRTCRVRASTYQGGPHLPDHRSAQAHRRRTRATMPRNQLPLLLLCHQ
jgi:hypothetical protein